MKSAGNEGVVQSSLQMLHIHVLLVATLSTGHVAKSGADQHQGGLPVILPYRKILISKQLSKEIMQQLGICDGQRIKLTKGNRKYLTDHRKQFDKKE